MSPRHVFVESKPHFSLLVIGTISDLVLNAFRLVFIEYLWAGGNQWLAAR